MLHCNKRWRCGVREAEVGAQRRTACGSCAALAAACSGERWQEGGARGIGWGMSDETGTYPYTLEALPCDKRAGHFRWVIRKHGKLIERPDKPYFSERAARKQAQAALERQFRSER